MLEAAESLLDVVYVMRTEPDPCFEYVSPAVERLVGYSPQEHYDDPSLGEKLIDPRDVDRLAAVLESPLDQQVDLTVRWIARDGRRVWTQHRCVRRRRSDGSVVVVGAARDVGEQHDTAERLAAAEARFRLIAENALDVVFQIGPDQTIAWVSPSVTGVLGWDPAELVGRPESVLGHPDDLPDVRAAQSVARQGQEPGEVEARYLTRDGGWRWMRVVGRTIRDDSDRFAGAIATARDIQAEMDARIRLAFEVDHDPLTGLANRSLALTRVVQALGERRPVTLISLGIDDLRAINEGFTQTAGDRVLAEVAGRLVSAAGARDRVARVSGNEFQVLVAHPAEPAELADLATVLIEAAGHPVTIGGHHLHVSVSAGIATGTGDGTPASTGNVHARAEGLLRDASVALHAAKAAGGNRWQFLDTHVADRSRRQLLVRSGLSDALLAGRLAPWFQPLVRLSTGEVAGYEALVRWTRPDGEVTLPDSFIPVAERTGLIADLDRHVLRAALAQLSMLPAPMHVAVNLSAATLAGSDVVADVTAAVAHTGADLTRLHLEVTETSLLHVTDDVRSAMARLADLGVTWWVDDFGTGYSSLTHLRDLPVQGLKLDRSFIDGVVEDDGRRRLAHAVLGFAHGLGLLTTAEGVETEGQARLLTDHGWDFGQGWWFGRPAPTPRPHPGG